MIDLGNVVVIKGVDIYFQDVVEDRVGSGNRYIEFGCDSKVCGGGNDGINYVEYEQSRRFVKGCNIDDFGLNGIGNMVIYIQGFGEFYDRSIDYGLEISN